MLIRGNAWDVWLSYDLLTSFSSSFNAPAPSHVESVQSGIQLFQFVCDPPPTTITGLG